MDAILSRCGYRCDLCLAYRPNVEANPSNPQTLSDGWHKYFSFRIPAGQIICDGCMAENPCLIDKSCPVRPCVIERGFANCATGVQKRVSSDNLQSADERLKLPELTRFRSRHHSRT
jgi:hypothetical protein